MPKLLWVEWIDSASRPARPWSSPLEWVGSAGLIRTVGWLVYEDESILVIAPSMEEDENVAERFLSAHSIPRGAITAWGEVGGLWS